MSATLAIREGTRNTFYIENFTPEEKIKIKKIDPSIRLVRPIHQEGIFLSVPKNLLDKVLEVFPNIEGAIKKGSDLTLEGFTKDFFVIRGEYRKYEKELKEIGAQRTGGLVSDKRPGMKIEKSKLSLLLELFPAILRKDLPQKQTMGKPSKTPEKSWKEFAKEMSDYYRKTGEDVTYGPFGKDVFIARGSTDVMAPAYEEFGGGRRDRENLGWIFPKSRLKDFRLRFPKAQEVRFADYNQDTQKIEKQEIDVQENSGDSGEEVVFKKIVFGRKKKTIARYELDFEAEEGDILTDESNKLFVVQEVGDAFLKVRDKNRKVGICWYVGGSLNGYLLKYGKSYLLLKKK